MASVRLAARVGALVLLAFVAPGCGDDEPAQRKAFIEFLQTRIIAKAGLHVPTLTDQEAKKFGPYAKDYAIIADFNREMNQTVTGPMQKAVQNGSVHSIADVVGRHADFIAVRDGMAGLRTALDRSRATADAAHGALHQPDDLKSVFDEAYRRDVTLPAQAFTEIFPPMSETLDAIIALGDFLIEHKSEITLDGPLIQTSNSALQTQLNALLAAVNAKGKAITQAQQKLRSVATGR